MLRHSTDDPLDDDVDEDGAGHPAACDTCGGWADPIYISGNGFTCAECACPCDKCREINGLPAEGPATHCRDCGQPLLLRRPGRDQCARCGGKRVLMPEDY